MQDREAEQMLGTRSPYRSSLVGGFLFLSNKLPVEVMGPGLDHF